MGDSNLSYVIRDYIVENIFFFSRVDKHAVRFKHCTFSGTVAPSGLATAILSPWENSAPDCGLSIVWSHLESARKMTENLPLFRRNAEIVLEGSRSDELLSDAFRTEFHIKFLWGSRGATVAPEERHLKFIQVLDAMFDKCSSTEVTA